MGYSKVCYKFNFPVDCQQLPIIETPDGKVQSMLDHFDPQGPGFADITVQIEWRTLSVVISLKS